MNAPSPLLSPLKRIRFDLAVMLIAAAVFIPKAVREYKPEALWFGDNPYYMMTTHSLVQDGDLDLKNQLKGDLGRIRDSVGLGTEGEWYSTHPILMPVAAIPFYLLMGNAGFLVFNVAVLVGLVLLMYRVSSLYARTWAALAAALAFAFTTQIMGSVVNFSPDAFSTFVTLMAVLLVLKDRPLAGGLFWGLAILSRTPNVVLYCAVFPFLFMGKDRLSSSLRFLAGSVPFMALFLFLNKVQYGGFFTLSYSRCLEVAEDGRAFINDIGGHFGIQYAAAGWWGQLVDRDHGLLFTNTVAVVGALGACALIRRAPRAAALILLVALVNYIFHGFFKLWYVSGVGSNRYLYTTIVLMAVPFAVLLDLLLDRSGKDQSAT